MGMYARRVSGAGGIKEGISSKEENEKTRSTTKKFRRKKQDNCIIVCCSLALFHVRKRGIRKSRMFCSMIVGTVLLLFVCCFIEEKHLGKRRSVAKVGTSHLPVRDHTFSYFDVNTNEHVTRTIRIASPALKRIHRRFNYYEEDHPERVNFNDPDVGAAFPIENADNRQCFPMGLWQTANYQTCNTLHEMEKANHNEMFMRFINCGESRCTFLFQDNTERTVVFKTLKLREDPKKPTHFGGRGAYRRAIKDSLALEKLTSSPYIVDIYASCALGQIQEYSAGGNIHDLLKRSRKEKQLDSGQRVPTKEHHTHHNKHHDHHHHEDDGATADKFPHRPLFISPISKLKIAFHVASAVADMHSLEQHPDGLPSMVHNDLCCHQFLLVDGIYKLGDFDWVTFLTQTTPAGLPGATTTNLRRHLKPEVCQTTPVVFNHEYHKALAPEEFPYYKDLKRALEEEGYKDEHHAITRVHRDKMDVYQIGTLLYTLVTHKWIWEGRTTDSAMVEATHVRFVY